MVKCLFLWTIFSFVILFNYSRTEDYYSNSDYYNLFVMMICFPAVMITVTFLLIIENIEKGNKYE